MRHRVDLGQRVCQVGLTRLDPVRRVTLLGHRARGVQTHLLGLNHTPSVTAAEHGASLAGQTGLFRESTHRNVPRGAHLGRPERFVPLLVNLLQRHDVRGGHADVLHGQREPVLRIRGFRRQVRIELRPRVTVRVGEDVVGHDPQRAFSSIPKTTRTSTRGGSRRRRGHRAGTRKLSRRATRRTRVVRSSRPHRQSHANVSLRRYVRPARSDDPIVHRPGPLQVVVCTEPTP